MDRIRPFSEDISTGSENHRESEPKSVRAEDGSIIKDPKKYWGIDIIKGSRKEVIADLLRQKVSPTNINYILLTEPKSDWTTTEIKKILSDLGISQSELKKFSFHGEFYHKDKGWY